MKVPRLLIFGQLCMRLHPLSGSGVTPSGRIAAFLDKHHLVTQPQESSSTLSPKQQSHRVCVIGAGAAGLSAAWQLQQNGHQVTVLEKSHFVGGKCDSVTIDGFAFDWGGYACSEKYNYFREMVSSFDCKIEPLTPTVILDRDGNIVPLMSGQELMSEFNRYQELRSNCFPQINKPGLHHTARFLWQPIAKWFHFHDLEILDKFTAHPLHHKWLLLSRGGDISGVSPQIG
jgi:hypothetical protein